MGWRDDEEEERRDDRFQSDEKWRTRRREGRRQGGRVTWGREGERCRERERREDEWTSWETKRKWRAREKSRGFNLREKPWICQRSQGVDITVCPYHHCVFLCVSLSLLCVCVCVCVSLPWLCVYNLDVIRTFRPCCQLFCHFKNMSFKHLINDHKKRLGKWK